MNDENLALLEAAALALNGLLPEVVFVGGTTIELWITDVAAPEFRPTNDVDVVIEVTTKQDYYAFEERLRSRGFKSETASGVICRFLHPDHELVLDVMPTKASILGFAGHWLAEGFGKAVTYSLPSGRQIQRITPPFLLATKLEAFADRGKRDFYGSRDFADMIALIDGREEMIEEVNRAPLQLRSYVSEQLRLITEDSRFRSGVDAQLEPEPSAQQRATDVVIPRITSMICSIDDGAI